MPLIYLALAHRAAMTTGMPAPACAACLAPSRRRPRAHAPLPYRPCDGRAPAGKAHIGQHPYNEPAQVLTDNATPWLATPRSPALVGALSVIRVSGAASVAIDAQYM